LASSSYDWALIEQLPMQEVGSWIPSKAGARYSGLFPTDRSWVPCDMGKPRKRDRAAEASP